MLICIHFVLGRFNIQNRKTDNLSESRDKSLSDQINFGGSTKLFDRIKFRETRNIICIFEIDLNQKNRPDFKEDEPMQLLMKQCIRWENNRK